MIAEALAGTEPDRVVVSGPIGGGYDLDATIGHAAAASGALACAAAIDWIRGGVAQRVLVVTVSADAGAVALVWERPPR